MTIGTPPPAPWGPPPTRPAVRSASPARLLLMFVLGLAGVIVVVGAVVLTVVPPRVPALCPDPTVPCAQPPTKPTLEPGGTAAAATPRATIFRPGGSAASPAPGGTSLALPMPTPRPASRAGRLPAGVTWRSAGLGFSLDYDDGIWTIEDQGANGVFLTAARGNVALTVVGFSASQVSARDAMQREVDRSTEVILGFAAETEAARIPPGTPIIGFQPGVGGVYAGTINTPQGPSANVSIGILAATQGDLTILVNVTTIDQLREPAFHIVDGILNSVQWPGRTP